MPNMSKHDILVSDDIVKSCLKQRRLYLKELINISEYYKMMTLNMVSVIETDLPRCIETIPDEHIAPFTEHLRAELEPVDFMPDPMMFLMGSFSEAKIENKKRELRPKYLRLYHSMTLRNAELKGD